MDDRGCRLFWLMLLILVPTAGANGQRLDSPAPARESLTLEIIVSRQAQAEETPDLEDEPRQRIAQLYTSATGHIERCESLKTRQAELSTSREDIADRLAKTQNQIQEVDSSEPDPLAQSTRNYLEQETLRRQLRLDELRQKLAGIEEQITSRPARRQEIRSRLAAAEEELESLNREIDADTPTAEPPLLTLAKRTNLVALLQQLEVEMPALREELALYDAEDVVEFLRFQRDLVTRQVALAEGELELVAKATTRVREQTAQEAIEKTRHDAAEVDPAFTKLAERNNELAQLNGQVLQQVAAAEKERDRIESQYTKLNAEFKLCQDRVKNVVGLPASLGAVLRKQRSEMPSIRGHVREIKKRQQLVDEAQLARLDLEEQHSRLTQIKTEVEQVISHNPKIPDDAKALLKSQASDLFSRQQELLESLVRAESSYFDALSTTSLKQQQLVETCRQFSNFIDERVLWIRSDPSLFSKSCWQELSGEKLPFDQLAGFAKLLREDVKNKTVWYLALGTLGLIVLRAGMTLKQVLAKLGDKARRGSFTEFYPTIQATLITFTLALPVPLLVGFLAWRLRSVAGDDANLPSILAGLLTFAAAFVPFELARQICRPDGLADAHFQWPATAVRILRSWLRVLVIVIPILGMTVAMLSFQSQPDSGPSARRLAFIFTVLVYALFLARLLHPGNGVLTEYLNRHQHGWLFRLRYPLHWLAISLPLGLATMAAVGYFYTAEQLSIRFYVSLALILLSFVVYSLLLRSIVIQRRKLRIAQAKTRQTTAAAEQAGHSRLPGQEDRPLADLRDQSDQTRRFLSAVLVGAIMLGCWGIWHGVFPALDFLERWPLWTTTQKVSETFTDDSGNLQVRSREVADKITIAELTFAFLIGVGTLVAARNVPGLLEIAVLQRLPLDNSVRYAISTLAKYVIVLVGLFIAFRTIGLRWGQIQWMVTALTFGLAFGLQEMFANFVAGLIILFERPIRVGDIVTVDEVTGTVARVRMRATTITNYDRKDYIVPNKDFITGRVLNWTLSDKVNRIVIPIGVAYGSDKQLVRKTLRTIASQHELVVEDPPPLVTFENFADSSLTFVLRCYIAMRDMPNRLELVDDLHMQIDDAFRAANIEIAFPQQDLHIRSMPMEMETSVSRPASGASEKQPSSN